MMNWIHPGFLSSIKSFTLSYIEPIERGLFSDSGAGDRKHSQKVLLRLKGVLDGKILRRDITAIEADLPSKTEFVIYVSLSPLQRQLYEALVKYAGWKREGNSLFKWINILRLICNHPYTLHVHPPVLWANDRNISATVKRKQKGKQTVNQTANPKRTNS
jgi:DNA repair and recombination RAD54-like protein